MQSVEVTHKDVRIETRLCDCLCLPCGSVETTVWGQVAFTSLCKLNRGSKCKICAHRCLRMAVDSITALVYNDKSGSGKGRGEEWITRDAYTQHILYSYKKKKEQRRSSDVVSDMEIPRLCSRGAWQGCSYVLSGQTTCILADTRAWQRKLTGLLANILL